MKKFSKVIIALVMLATAFAFVGCGTPAWQQVDTINTNANYEATTYEAMQQEIQATGDNAIQESTGKIKLSFTTKTAGVDLTMAGVLDTDPNAENIAALKCDMTMDIAGTKATMNLVMYVTKTNVYLEGKKASDKEQQDLRVKLTYEELGLMGDTFEGQIEQFMALADLTTILDGFELEVGDQDKCEFKVATELDGTKKYLMTLKEGQTIDDDIQSVTKGVSYLAVKDNRVVEVYISSEYSSTGLLEGFSSSTTMSLKEYNGDVPQPSGEYKTFAEVSSELA